MSESQLIVPPFDDPRCRFERIARFTNDRGQQFFLVVRGYNQERVLEIAGEIKVSLEVRPDHQPQRSDARPDDKLLEQQQPSVEIVIGALMADGIEPPYILHFEIDPPIQAGEQQSYSFIDTTMASVLVQAVNRTVRADLFQGSTWVDGRTVDAYVGGNPAKAIVDDPRKPGESTSFKLIVTGIEDGSRYSLKGDVLKGAYESYP